MRKQAIFNMTRGEFEVLPSRGWDEDIGPFDSLVILPAEKINLRQLLIHDMRIWLSKKFPKMFARPDYLDVEGLHESGFRCMDFIACRGGEPVCKLSSCSDVINIEGIGGYGEHWLQRYGTVPKVVSPIGWSIDCLPRSGLLRIFCGVEMTVGLGLSSFELFSKKRGNRK
jgi:hypothetical protein